jgi:hypothetical protein
MEIFSGNYYTPTSIEMAAIRKFDRDPQRALAGTLSSTGYDDPDPMIRYRIWNSLGLGEQGIAFFDDNFLLNHDLSLPEVGRDTGAAALPLRRGNR